MSNTIFYNAPCSVWRRFLERDYNKENVLDQHLFCAIAKVYDTLDDIEDEKERFRKACSILNCKTHADNLSIGHNNNYQYKKDALFSLSHDMFWDFYKNYKSEEECTLLLAYLALKSIIGAKSYAKTNKDMWLSRMDGKTRSEYKSKRDGSRELILSDSIKKWSTNYGIRKLKALLWKYYHVSFYSKSVHGFYASISLDDKDLAATVQKNKKASTIYDEFGRSQIAANEAVTSAKPF